MRTSAVEFGGAHPRLRPVGCSPGRLIKFTSVCSLGVTGGLDAMKAGVGRGRSSWDGPSVHLSLGLPLGPRTGMGGRERTSRAPAGWVLVSITKKQHFKAHPPKSQFPAEDFLLDTQFTASHRHSIKSIHTLD